MSSFLLVFYGLILNASVRKNLNLLLKLQIFWLTLRIRSDEVRPGPGKLNFVVFLQKFYTLDNVSLMMEHLKTWEEYELAVSYIQENGNMFIIEFLISL
jgi:hypothetical protein